MNTFSVAFLIVLAATVGAQAWLAQRHIRHVRARRDAVPSAFADKIPLAAHQKAADYTVARTRLGRVEAFIGALLLLIWTFGGGLDGLDRLWRGFNWPEPAIGTAFVLSVLLIGGALDLPVSLYRTFVIEQRFGFNRTTPGLFLVDLIKGTGLSLALGAPIIFAILWLMQGMGVAWWLYVWVLWVGVSLFMVWAYPTLIAPLFNRFKPLTEGGVRHRIEGLLARTGFKSKGIFVVDSSKRTAHGNAYFTGFGRNKRIVFFDSLLKTLAEDEVEAVVAHELGHFKLRHILKRLLLMAGISFAGLALLGWLIHQPWFYSGLGVTHASNHVALVLLLLTGPVFTFFLGPLMARGSRRHEFEADAFAAKQTDARALVAALVKLYQENAATLTPDPLHSAFYDSHPPASIRIAQLLAKT